MKSKVSSPKVFNIVLCVIILLVFVLTIGVRTNAEVLTESSSEVIPLSKQLGIKYPELSVVSVIELNEQIKQEEKKEVVLDLDYYLNEYRETIMFFSKLFDYSYEGIINDLQEKNLNKESFILTNIGSLKDEEEVLFEYSSFEYGLIEYFYYLNDTSSNLRSVNYRPYNGNADYVEDLILYFSSIYTNVDATTLLSIGAAESGYYQVKFMLNYNNVYGGMSRSGLIRHNNIEQGVLSFVRLMSRNYYGNGLDTMYEIGRVYCPVFENDIKVASPHWINLVSRATTKYNTYTHIVTIKELTNIEEV